MGAENIVELKKRNEVIRGEISNLEKKKEIVKGPDAGKQQVDFQEQINKLVEELSQNEQIILDAGQAEKKPVNKKDFVPPGWQKMKNGDEGEEELQKFQSEGRLIGHDPILRIIKVK